ncbi:MAG: DUF3560 domain-containing protein [Bacteroidales bacterium]|nr:DUF3560 domain-containing protein [Bacteroidales bacterium]
MNSYYKFAPNVYLAKCEEKHERGDIIPVTTKYGKENDSVVYNLIFERDGFYYYSIVRADGYNVQERARRKAERYEQAAANADRRSEAYYEKSNKDADFLSLGEPIKVGHHSEGRHRRMIEDAWRNTGKFVEEANKANAYRSKADGWERHTEDINLSMPESIDYYADKLEKATEYHQGVKSGKYPRTHAYTLTYAKNAVNEAKKNLDMAKRLWGEKEDERADVSDKYPSREILDMLYDASEISDPQPNKSKHCRLVLLLMDSQYLSNNYCGSLGAVLKAYPEIDKMELEKELEKYV